MSEPTQPSNEKGAPDVGLCPRLLAPLRCGIDRGNVPHTFILAEAGLLAVSVRMGLNRQMGEKLRDRRRICSEDDEKKASSQSKSSSKKQRTGLAGA